MKSVLERNVSFFILLGSCVYIIKGSSMFLTGHLEDYPSRRLSSLKHLSMYLTLSTEWSESQLSAPCFSSPPAQVIFLAALIISSTYIFSVLYGFLSCNLFHRPCSHLKNATQCFPSRGFCLTHRQALVPTWHWQIPLTCSTFLHPSPLSDHRAATLLPLSGAVPVPHRTKGLFGGPLPPLLALSQIIVCPYSCYSSHCPFS